MNVIIDDGIIVDDPDYPDAMFVCQNEDCLEFIYQNEEAVIDDDGRIVHVRCQRFGHPEP